MPHRHKIDLGELEKLSQANLTEDELARVFKCTKGAISLAMKRLNLHVKRHAMLHNNTEIVNSRIDMASQLQKINDSANKFLDLAIAWMDGDAVALENLQKLAGNKDLFKAKDPREIALKAMQEIREQIKLQFQIFQGLVDIQAMTEFQQEVLNAIGEATPEVRAAIISKLKERHFLRSAHGFPRTGSDDNGGETTAHRNMGLDGELDGGPFSIQGP